MNTNVQDLNKALLSLLECLTCKKYMVPPIRQCANGHNLCSVCISSMANCPECGQKFIKARNHALEEIAQKLDFPCEFREKGCIATFKIENLEHHQTKCPHNMLRCRIEACKIWSSQLPILVEHVKEVHPDSFLSGSFKELEITKWESSANHWYVYFLSAIDQHFWLHYRLMGKLNKLLVAVQNMEEGNYRYEVTMGSADSTLIKFSSATCSGDRDMNAAFMVDDCFCITTRTAKNFIKSGKTLNFQVSVKQA